MRAPLALARRHPVLVALLVVAIALRALVFVTFQPALEYLQDSYDYIVNAQNFRPSVLRPILYPAVLKVVGWIGGLELVPLLNHLMGITSAVLLYAVLHRAGVRKWLAALAVAPLLLDAYQIGVEQFVLSEPLFQLLIVTAVAALMWNPTTSWRAAAIAGAALAGVALTRSVGLPLLIPAFLLLVVRRSGWRPVAAFVTAAAVLLVPYVSWFASLHGPPALQRYSGVMLASRAMVIADCSRIEVLPHERPMCVPVPPGRRATSDWYAMAPESPLRNLQLPPGLHYNDATGAFAKKVLREQPADYARLVWRDFRHYFRPGRETTHLDLPIRNWQFAKHKLPKTWFPLGPLPDPYRGAHPYIGGEQQSTVASYGLHGERLTPTLWPRGQAWLASYQDKAFTPGPLLLLCAVVAVVAGGARRLDPQLRRLHLYALYLAGSAIGLMVLTTMTTTFEYRYLLPTLVLLPPAGALAAELLLQRLRARGRAADPVPRPVPGAAEREQLSSPRPSG